ncbi:MAG: YIP1 family protein [Piscinibacter sp.]|nr:YIP1 family protein [Piscinibacter sp.]
MNLIQRVQDILLKPKETWPVIAAEPATVASIYQNWLIFLAAIPAVAAFIGLSIVGVGGFGYGFRVPILSGLVHMVLSYALSLGMVFVLSLIVDALAPTFGGTKDPIAALKVVAYGSTAGFVGGIFSLIPMLGVLGILASLYSIYLIYLGLPVLMMRNPQDKSAAYTAVVIVCSIVAMIILSAITSMLLPGRGMGGGFGGMHGGGDVTLKVPGGEVNIDTQRMEEMARKMEEAGKRMEQAQKRGDGDAAGKALGEIMGAMGGAAGGGAPLPAADLKALLPESIGGMARESFEAQSNTAMGIASSSARARYGSGDRRVELKITDMGSLAGLAGLAGWANMTVDRETDGQVEKVYKQGNRTVREQFRKDGSHGEVTVILPNGVLVEAEGQGVDPASLKKVVDGVDLARLESMQRPAK